MSKVLIRRAQFGDKAAIHEAHMRSIREVCVKDHGEEEIKGWVRSPAMSATHSGLMSAT